MQKNACCQRKTEFNAALILQLFWCFSFQASERFLEGICGVLRRTEFQDFSPASFNLFSINATLSIMVGRHFVENDPSQAIFALVIQSSPWTLGVRAPILGFLPIFH